MASSIPFSALSLSLSTKGLEIKKPWRMCMKQRAQNMKYRKYTVCKAVSSTNNSNNTGTNLSASDTIKQFYNCINDKNINQLGNYISNDCFFEDFSFPKPFQGKKEVLNFLVQLTTGMGQNMEFRIEHVYEGEDSTAGVNWNLEWKKRQVPFTRGCSLYGLTREGERLVIRKAQVFIESPIRPGDLMLSLLKIVTSLFDAFPEATEWFLRSQEMILQLFLKVYSIILVPFISPILAFYVNIGNFIARLLSLTLKILISCSRLFTKR